jgi:hypothetical protein
MLLGLTPAPEPDRRMAHERAALTSTGTVKATIDLDKVPGMGTNFIQDFAPGPDGEIYVLAKKIVVEHFAEDQNGRVYERYHEEDPQLWVLRFSDTGRLLTTMPIEAEFAYVHLGVFPSDSFLVVGYLSVASLPGVPLPDHNLIPVCCDFSRDGKLVRQVELPDTVLLPEPRSYGIVERPGPMLGADGNMYVVLEGSEKPALTVVHPDGAVSGTVTLHIPNGYLLAESRFAGERLIAEVNEN